MLMDQYTSNTANSQFYFKFRGDDALMENEYKVYLMNRLARRQATFIIMKH